MKQESGEDNHWVNSNKVKARIAAEARESSCL